ncbi:MAG: 30S ribosomal protein S20 [Ruthenibacterium lactatiformans]
MRLFERFFQKGLPCGAKSGIINCTVMGIKEVVRCLILSRRKTVWCRRKRGSAQQSDQVNLKTVVKKAGAAISASAADKDAAVRAAVVAIDKAAAKVCFTRTRLPQGFPSGKAADKAGK